MAVPNKTTTPSAEDVYLSEIINGAHGDVYQRDLALVMFERATRKEYDFRLGYEMSLADKFDDVAFFNKTAAEWILVQTKHADTTSKGKPASAIKWDMLFPRDDASRDKGDFSLFKYFKSYVNVRNNIGERKHVVIFTNRDFLVEDVKESVGIEPRKVDEILLFDHGKHLRLKVGDKLMEEMLNYTNRDFISLKDSIVKLFTEGIVDQVIKSFKTPVAAMLTKTDTCVKFRETSPESLEMLKSLSDLIDIRTAQLPLAKCKDLFTGNSRNKSLPLLANKEMVHQFFADLVLSVRQPDDLRDFIEQDLRSWMRTWIRPSYLTCLEEAQLRIGTVRLEEFFNQKQSGDGSGYKKFLQLADGKEFFESVGNDLESQIRKLSNYNANDTGDYYVGRQILFSGRMPKFSSDRIRDEEFVKELLSGKFDNHRLLLLSAEPGMGKSTILEYIAFVAQKLGGDYVYHFNLNMFHHKLEQVEENDSLEKLLSILEPALSKENFEGIKGIDIDKSIGDRKYFMVFDAFDEVFPKNRTKVIKLFIGILKAENVKILVSARRTVKAEVESALNVKSMSLVPFNDNDQTNFLRKFWKVTKNNECRFIKYKTHLFKLFHSDVNRALVEFTGLPLMLKMLGEVYGDNFEKYLESEQSNLEELPQEMFSTIKLYENFVIKCFTNRMKKKLGDRYLEIDDDNIGLFKTYTLEHQLLAFKHLKLNVLEKIVQDESHAETLDRVEKRISNCTERSALVEAADNNFRFIHRSYAEYLVATFLFSEIGKQKAIIFEEFMQASLFVEFPMVRIFFFAMVETKCKDKHLKHIKSYYLKNSDIALWACEVHGQKTIESLLDVKCDLTIVNRLLCAAAEHKCLNICTYLLENHLNMVDCNFTQWVPLEDNYSRRSKGWNPLHIAAQRGNLEVIELILRNSGNANVRNDRGWTPLHIAASNGDFEVAKILIKNFADVNAKENKDGTPIHCASCFGHTDVIKLLLDNSADVDAVTSEDWTALLYAAHNGQTAVVQLLINRGANVNAKNNEGYTALHSAALNGHTRIVEILMENNANFGQDRKGWTPFHHAAQNGHLQVLNILIETIADIDAKTNSLRTPLHLASEGGNTDIVKVLINYPCQVNVKDYFDCTPLHYAAASGNVDVVALLIQKFDDINEKENYGRTPLHFAAEHGHTNVVRLLLNHHSVNVNAKDNDGCTPLHLAVECGHSEIVKVLLSSSADINAKTDDERTPIHIATENGHTKVVEVLIASLADISAKGDCGRTSLHYASKNGHLKIVETLIDHLDVNAKDATDWTALHYAAQNGHWKVIEILVEHIRNVNAKDYDGRIPLHYAAKNGDPKAFELLIDHASGNVKARDKVGCTPLHFAAQNGHSELVKTLIVDHSVKVNARNIYDWTPLLFATQNGHSNVVRVLIDHVADVNAKNNKGRIPLHYAAKNGHQDVVELLVSLSSENVDMKDNDGRTPLHHASTNGHLEIVERLVEDHSADINSKDIQNWTPLHFAAESGNTDVVGFLINRFANVTEKNKDGAVPLHYAARNGHQDVIELIIKNCSEIIHVYDNEGCTALHLASEYGHSEVVKTLIDHFANVNAKTEKGLTLLHYAAKNGHQEVVQLLINHSSEIVDVEDNDGRTPLHFASKHGHLEIVKTLLEDHSADVNAKDIFNWTPLHYAAENGHVNVVAALIDNFAKVIEKDNDGAIPLHYAARNGHQDVVQLLIGHFSENVNIFDNDGRSPLHLASKNGHLEVVKVLIGHSANVNAKTQKGWTALHYAAKNGHPKVVQFFIELSSEIINAKDFNNWTPLHYAAQNGHANVAKILLDHFANINAKNNEGSTPLHYAAGNGHQELVELLIGQTSVNLKAKDNDRCTARKLAAKNDHSSIVLLLKREAKKRSLTRKSLKWVRHRFAWIRNAVMNISRQS